MWQAGFVSVVLLFFVGCSPRFTSKPIGSPDYHGPEASPEEIFQEATDAYEHGVDLFVNSQFDSASLFFDYAVSLLTSDINWSKDAYLADQRRILLYKCRYYLERMPSEIHEAVDSEEIKAIKPPLPPIEIEYNERVKKWIDYFTGSGRTRLMEWLARSGRYRNETLRILREEGLPDEIINLALIESGFNPNAYSRAHAVGIWQFIRSTAVIYGLRVDSWVDERRDPIRSARAAARHIRDLYEAFDSWPLALAAYNCGQKNVERAIKRANSKDFWKLPLKRETSEYVPQFMAACIIMQDPERYGLRIDYEKPLRFEEIEVGPRTDLKAIAKGCGVPPEVIFDLNPHFVRRCVPPGLGSYPVRVPEGMGEKCIAELSKMAEGERFAKDIPASYIRHTVRRGETVTSIARKYSTTATAVAKANGISTKTKLSVGQVLLIPSDAPPNGSLASGVHIVKRGETLSGIAATYGVRLRDLVEWNGLKSPDTIYPGQKIKLSNGAIASAGSASQKTSSPPASSLDSYVVRKGDTLSGIAKRCGVSLKEICEINNLTTRSIIYPGQELKIRKSEDKGSIYHEVKKGETVSSIAKAYGVSISQVLDANNLKPNDSIYPGQKLRIPSSLSGSKDKVHIVKKGESIARIADVYGVSPNVILEVNGLRPNDIIHPGQRIRIPQ